MSVKLSPQIPAYICGKIRLDYYQNPLEEFKQTDLKDLCKGLRKEFNISASPSHEQLFANPEQGHIVIAFVATNMERAKEAKDKITKYIDAHSSGRIGDETYIEEEFE
jgi:uncharacterized protein YlxP (DUF503 family)